MGLLVGTLLGLIAGLGFVAVLAVTNQSVLDSGPASSGAFCITEVPYECPV